MFLQSDDDNGSVSDNEYSDSVDDGEDEIIRGLELDLEWFNLDGDEGHEGVTPKGPVFRRNEVNVRPAPYQPQVSHDVSLRFPNLFLSKAEALIRALSPKLLIKYV